MFNQKNYAKRLKLIRSSYERNITVYTATEAECATCDWDSFQKRSKDPNCPTCKGAGVIITLSAPIYIKANIRWVNPQSAHLPIPGAIDKGRVILYCDYTHKTTLETAYKIIVDAVQVQVFRDKNGNFAIKPVRNVNGVLDRLKVIAEVKQIG